MINILRYTEYLYIVVFGFAAYRVVMDWNVNRNMAYMFIFFALVSLGMFFFRRTYRKRFEKRQRENQN